VTAVGVSLPPVQTGPGTLVSEIELGFPLLIQGIAVVLGEPLQYGQPGLMVNPVLVGGWVGAFVTFLNLLPVGQLDGAHVARAVVGERIDTLGTAVPLALFGLAGYLLVFADGRGAFLWLLWGVIALVFTRVGGATPVDDSPVGPRRQAVALLTLVVGALCFTPVPIAFAP
jgi:membrane-associated protease RseP (regulator of RpoE activity)